MMKKTEKLNELYLNVKVFKISVLLSMCMFAPWFTVMGGQISKALKALSKEKTVRHTFNQAPQYRKSNLASRLTAIFILTGSNKISRLGTRLQPAASQRDDSLHHLFSLLVYGI